MIVGPKTFAARLVENRQRTLFIGYLEDAIDTAIYMYVQGSKQKFPDETNLETLNWTGLKNPYFVIGFYENSDDTNRIHDSTNVTIEISDDFVPEGMCCCLDIFNTHIDLVDEICGDTVERIIIKWLNVDDLDEGYVFQLQSAHKVFPFELELFKRLVEFAKKLKTDDECLTT